MKKFTLLLSAMLLACATNLWAETATFGDNWNALFGTTYNGSISGVKQNEFTLTGSIDGVTLTVANGTSTSAFIDTADFRAYKGYTITITAPDGYVLTQLTSTKGGKNFDSNICIAANVGALSISNNAINWTGSYDSVVLSMSGTVSFATITATYVSESTLPTLTSLVVAETEKIQKEYIEYDAFDVTGLSVTANYSDNSSKDVTAYTNLTWSITPEELVEGTTSVSVVATLDGVSSETTVVKDIIVNVPQPGETVTVTFVAGTDVAAANAKTTISKKGVTLTASTFDLASYYQTFKSASFKATSTKGKIQSIVFTCTAKGTASYGPSGYVVPLNGIGTYTYATDATTGTWSGSATEVVLSADSGQVRMTKVEVTYKVPDPEAPDEPVISGEAIFNGSTEVTITAGEGMKIFYTTNGDEPTTSSTPYTASLTITATTTVKAIAFDETKSKVSDVTEKTFRHQDAVALESVDYATNGTKVFLQPVTVVYANGSYTYLKDETGVGLLYGGSLNLSAGDMVAGIAATTYQYSKLPQLIPTVTAEDIAVTPGVAPSPKEAIAVPTAAEVNTYLLLKGVALAADAATISGTSVQNVTVVFKDGSIVLRDIFGVVTDGTLKAGSYDMEGFVGVYNTTVQFYATKITSTATAIDNASIEAPALKTIENGQLVILRDGVKYNAMGVRLQ